jgi:glycosyltransferase involved in cell wall biosynthesis
MQIIHLTLGKINPARMNGVNVSIHNLASAQVDLGCDVAFWGITTAFETHDYPVRNFKTSLFPASKRPFSLHPRLQKALDDVPTDAIFHLHGGLLPALWAVGRQLKKRDISFIYTPHGTFTDGAFERHFFSKMSYLHIFDRFLLKNAASVLVLGDGERDFLRRFFPKIRLEMIPNGQNPLRSHAEIDAQPRSENAPIFGFCGRLNKFHKGLDILLDGFFQYKKMGGGGQLLLIGDGDDRVFLEKKAAELGILHSVLFAGFLTGAAKRARLLTCDVFVHSSRMEGFPMAILEAAALGLPLLVSEFTNVGDYVRKWESGWVLPENDAKNLGIALFSLEKQDLRATRHRALAMIEGQFSSEKVAAAVLELYQKTTKNDVCQPQFQPA